MNLVRKWTIFLGIATVVAIGIYGIRLIQRGFSTREQPSIAEAFMAQKARRWAMPAGARNLKNHVPATAEMLEHGQSHWADHCATCHANNGSGQTEIGSNLYPKPPHRRGPPAQSPSDRTIY